MLTAGSETVTGTDANDLIIGVVSSLNSEKTLDSADVIDGGKGTDTLKLEMKGNLTAITGSVSNVENVELTNATTIARTFDTKNFSGVEKYTLDSAKGITLSNLAATGIEVAYKGTQGNTTIGFASKATDATTDAMSISLNGVGTAQVLKADGVTVQTAKVDPTITMAGIEDVTLKTTGTESFVDLVNMDATTLTISGDAALDITNIKAGLTTLDASTMTGALTANLTNAAATALKTVSTGSGDDALTIDAAGLVANATIGGGAGNDTLTLTDTVGSTLQLAMSGVETVALSNTSALTFSAKNVTDLTTVQVNADGNAAASFVNTGSADMTVNTVGAIAVAQAVSIDTTGSVTVNLTDTATNAAKNKALKGAAGANNVKTAADMTFANASSLTFNFGDYTEYTGTATASKATDVTLNVNSSKNSATTPTEQSIFNGELDVAKATSVTINSQGNTTLGAGSDMTAAESVTIAAGGSVTSTATGLDAAANVVLSGENTTSAVALGTIGTATTDYDVTVNATGLKAGLTVGNINSVQGATVNLTGTTGTVSLAAITAANVTVTASSLAGALSSTGAINSTVAAVNTGAAVIDVSSSAAAVTVGAIGTTRAFKTVTVDASDETTATTIGAITALDSVSVDFSGNLSTSAVGAIAAKAVTIDASNALKAVTIGSEAAGAADITVTDSLTYTAGLIGANNAIAPLDIAIDAAATDTTINLNGNIGNDQFIITTAAASTTDVKVTVAGNLDIGTNSVVVTAASLDGGAGADTLTGGAGADTFVIATAETGITVATADTITDFTTLSDKIDFSGAAAGTVLNYNEATAAVADFTAALTAVNGGILSTGVIYAFQFDGTNGYLFHDNDADGAADEVIVLTGIDNTGIAFGDIIA